jgi:7-carboxy-7-deazaguanine synthase
MFGQNPKRPPVKGDGHSLFVQSVFPTIQGEGPYAGHFALFIRLGGCNLACSFCDTEFESFVLMSCDQLIEEAHKYLSKGQLVVITGGEPLRQPIGLLCNRLLMSSYKVQIETNGTLYQALPDEVEIICSPKVTSGRYHPIHPQLLPRVNALKFLISSDHEAYDQVPNIGQYEQDLAIPIYIQPMDQNDPIKNANNTQRALSLVRSGRGILSLQLHKVLNIP